VKNTTNALFLNIRLKDQRHLYIKNERFERLREELELYLDAQKHMNTISFAKRVMFSHEIKSNNSIEGYNDDLNIIESVIRRAEKINDNEQKKRIINLYNGYKYILKKEDINKENLRKLYGILSNGLLDPKDLEKMGKYYRSTNGMVLYKGRRIEIRHDKYGNNIDLAALNDGVNAIDIDKFMDQYFSFANTEFGTGLATDNFIKSQILHYYLVHIHPYFDINGRTSRTTAMWYLLKEKAYPFIIFNRAVEFENSSYDGIIRDVNRYGAISYFINYMMENTMRELEKEQIIQSIIDNVDGGLNDQEYQTILYILSMKGTKTVKDFVVFYRRLNSKLSAEEIYKTMILPLLEKGIIDIQRETKTYIYDIYPNFVFNLCLDKIDLKLEKIKRIKI